MTRHSRDSASAALPVEASHPITYAGPMPNLTTKLADTMTTVGVRASYGEPLDLDGTRIVPVAISSYGFAADERGEADATKATGGGMSTPIGAYISRDGTTRFEPNVIALLAVGVPFVWVAGRALARVIRALKR